MSSDNIRENMNNEILTFNVWSGWNEGSSITYTVTGDGRLVVTERNGKDVNTTEVELTDEELMGFVDFINNDVVGNEFESQLIRDMGTTLFVNGEEYRNVSELTKKTLTLLNNIEERKTLDGLEEYSIVEDVKDDAGDIISFSSWSGWNGGSSKTYSIMEDGRLVTTVINKGVESTSEIVLNDEEINTIMDFVNNYIVGKDYESQMVFDAGTVLTVGERVFNNVDELNEKMGEIIVEIVNNHNKKNNELDDMFKDDTIDEEERIEFRRQKLH